APVPSREAEVRERPGLAGAFLSIYGLTMTNPLTIISFLGIFTGLGLAGGSGLEAALLTVGGFLGSASWGLLLPTIIGRIRHRLTPQVMLWINRVCGVILLGFGLAAIGVAVGLP